MKNLFAILGVGCALLTPVAMHATPLTAIHGQFSINGSVTPGTNMLTFDVPTIESSVHTQTLDFVTILGYAHHVSATGGSPVITFNPYAGGAFFMFPNLKILIQTINETNSTIGGVPYLVFAGQTILQSPGYLDTGGTFIFTTQAGNEVSFSATGVSTGIPAPNGFPGVPEPSSFVLLGSAALAGIGVMKKRLSY